MLPIKNIFDGCPGSPSWNGDDPPSRPIHSDCRVEVLGFDTGIGGVELPIVLGVVGIAVVLPCGDFLDEGLFIGNPTVEALGT